MRSVDIAKARGLTLIELMVVVVVLAILATVAIPTYERYQRSARRSDGKAALTAVALAEERVFSVYQKYVKLTSLNDLAGLDLDVVSAASLKSPKGRYTVTLPVQTASSFTAQAAPNNWTDPECQALQLTAAGEKLVVATGGGPAPEKGADYCW